MPTERERLAVAAAKKLDTYNDSYLTSVGTSLLAYANIVDRLEDQISELRTPPLFYDAVFTISLFKNHSTIHTKARKGIIPYDLLSRAIVALKEERDALKGCPVHVGEAEEGLIKKLSWDQFCDAVWTAKAEPLGTYSIQDGYITLKLNGFKLGVFEKLDQAFEAAQKDYETKIGMALK